MVYFLVQYISEAFLKRKRFLANVHTNRNAIWRIKARMQKHYFDVIISSFVRGLLLLLLHHLKQSFPLNTTPLFLSLFANTNALYFQYYLSHTQNYLFQYVVTLLHSLYKLIIEGDQLTQKVLTWLGSCWYRIIWLCFVFKTIAFIYCNTLDFFTQK